MDGFIEIPFGAEDSELKGWEYTIPDDMEAEIKDGKIIVRQKENKDEKIRKDILALVKKHAVNHERCQMEDYLEKQKEQPKEELVYRLNGLMQDYIKEGKDEEEREHRFKCYKLFWDALEDSTFFEQKEQKPAEWTDADEKILERIIDRMAFSIPVPGEGGLVGVTFKRTKDAEAINWLKSLRPVKQEWSKEDEMYYEFVLDGLRYAHADMDRVGSLDRAKQVVMGCEWFKRRIKSLRPQSQQPRWKPNKLQLQDLFIAGKEGCEADSPVANTLRTLYIDLTKL